MSAVVDLQQVFCLHRTGEGDAAPLQGTTLAVDAGEVVCVLGPSGAGKSTLLRVIAGLQVPSAGAVRVLGCDLGRQSARVRARLRRAQIGFIGQRWASALSPDLPLRQAVALPLLLRGGRAAEATGRATGLLESAGLGQRTDALAHELSGGERQRAAVCAALAHRPRLLLADEPTGELDAASAGSVRALLVGLAREAGATVIVVSHDPATSTVADRALRMRDGRIEAEVRAGNEALLVDLRGWLRLPDSLLARAGIDRRLHARAEPGEVILSRAGSAPAGAGSTPTGAGSTPAALAVLAGAEPATVEIRAVHREHRDGGRVVRTVLAGLSLAPAPGRVTVVTGRSGSGKSTLLRLIAGLERPDRGEILLDGAPLSTAGAEARAALRRARLGYLPQDPQPVGFLSAYENVVLTLRLRGVGAADASAQAEAAMAAVELAERSNQRVQRLSAGESQRVGLARALACARGLLLVDEPTSRLDEAGAARVAWLLSAAARSGHTVLCATHDEQLISRADAIVELEQPVV